MFMGFVVKNFPLSPFRKSFQCDLLVGSSLDFPELLWICFTISSVISVIVEEKRGGGYDMSCQFTLIEHLARPSSLSESPPSIRSLTQLVRKGLYLYSESSPEKQNQ